MIITMINDHHCIGLSRDWTLCFGRRWIVVMYCCCFFRPMVHLFGHAHQPPEVLEKHGVVFSNAAQFGFENGEPIVIDIYLPPTLALKTKLYKPPVWKEEQENPTEAASKKLACAILWTGSHQQRCNENLFTDVKILLRLFLVIWML